MQLPERRILVKDFLAGLTGAIAGAPQAMGFALLVDINPIYGLYTAIVSTIIGGFLSSSSFLTIAPTNALALVAGTALLPFDEVGKLERLFALTLLVGVIQVAFGIFKMGDLTRFVSNAVMTGFVSGAGILIILGQLSHMTGFSTPGESVLERFWYWISHIDSTHAETGLISVIALIIIGYLHHTRFKSIATLVGIFVTTVMVMVLDWEMVETVRDISEIPPGLPAPQIPQLIGHIQELLPVALALAVLASVQSAALTQNMPERDGSLPDSDRDFIAQGVGNIVGSFFSSMPSGGSLSRTAVNLAAGAESRFANIFAGAIIFIILVALGGLIEVITLSALAAHLVIAAISLINRDQIAMVWTVTYSGRIVMLVTFVSTLVLPLQYSIYIGVILSLGLYVYSSANNLEVVHMMPIGNNLYRELEIPKTLPDNSPIIFSIYGHLYFAAVSHLEELLPDPSSGQGSVVILRIRRNAYLGSTGIRFLRRYQKRLEANGGKLILAGISPELRTQLQRTHAEEMFGKENIFYADDIVYSATAHALEYAEQWLETQEATQPAPNREKPAQTRY